MPDMTKSVFGPNVRAFLGWAAAGFAGVLIIGLVVWPLVLAQATKPNVLESDEAARYWASAMPYPAVEGVSVRFKRVGHREIQVLSYAPDGVPSDFTGRFMVLPVKLISRDAHSTAVADFLWERGLCSTYLEGEATGRVLRLEHGLEWVEWAVLCLSLEDAEQMLARRISRMERAASAGVE